MYLDGFALGLVVGSLLTAWAAMIAQTVAVVFAEQRERKNGGDYRGWGSDRRPERLPRPTCLSCGTRPQVAGHYGRCQECYLSSK